MAARQSNYLMNKSYCIANNLIALCKSIEGFDIIVIITGLSSPFIGKTVCIAFVATKA